MPHWSGPGFVTLSFIAAAYLNDTVKAGSRMPGYLKRGEVLIMVVVSGCLLLIEYFPGTMSSNKVNVGAGDFTLDLNGWRSFGKSYNNWMVQPENKQYSRLKIVSNERVPAAHISYYNARPENNVIVGVGSVNDLHNFVWLNRLWDLKAGDNSLPIVPGNYNMDAPEVYSHPFAFVTRLQRFTERRNGRVCRYFTVYLLKNYNDNDEVHLISIK